MFEVEKEVKVTISGDDIQRLVDICELARRYVSNCSGQVKAEYYEKGYYNIKNFLNKVFEAGLT